MLKKMFALTSALTVLSGAAIAGQSCCAPKANQAGAQKSAAACCAKDAKTVAKKVAAKKAPAKKVAAKNAKSAKVKLTEVRVCPMMGGKVEGKGAATQVVGNYNVHFCCGPCKPEFNKLSKADQQKKIQEALKKQNAAAKTA